MNNQKNDCYSSIPTNSINVQIPRGESFLNPEKIKLAQDLSFFKNDILKDIRKLDEKFSIKINEQNITNAEKYNNIEKKLNELSNYISKVQTLVLDSNDIIEQIKTFGKFKTRAEDNFNRINSRISSFQKEYRDYINSIEKLVNENLRYPGVIGRNAKFSNFRYFIDYIIKNFKDVNEFKDEVRNFEINDFKKKINSDILDFRFTISDNYKNSVRLIGNTFKEFDVKIEDLIKKNFDNMKKNEEKFEELKNKINDYFSEYQTKFESLEKIINDKFKEQLNEIEKFKSIKEELVADINSFKSSLEEQKKEIINKNNNNEIQENIKNLLNDNRINDINNNIINDNIIKSTNNNGINEDGANNNEFKFHLNSRNINYKTILTRDKRNFLIKLLNNINEKDESQNNSEKNNIESSSNKRNYSLHIERSKSFEKIQQNFIDENNELKISQDKKKPDNKINILNKDKDRDIIRSNYSISNIPNIKFKKVIIPEHLIKRNMNQTARTFLSENKGIKMMMMQNNINNISTIKSIDNIDFNDSINYYRKNSVKIPKINKNRENKKTIIKLANSVQSDEKLLNIQLNQNIHSLLILKDKSKNNVLKNLENIKRQKNNSWSFECEKNNKDEQTQIELRNNMKNKIRETILMNSKKYKKTRKIEI
jgi:hypothetical protein